MLDSNHSTVTLIAESFNLPIFNQIWLVENNVVTKQEMLDSDTFQSPVAVNISTAYYELLVLQDRVQLTLKNADYNKNDIVNRVVKNLVQALPHTPYKAVGFNFRKIITLQDSEAELQKVKELYLSDKNPLSSFFQTDDSRFGLYLSTESIQGTRLRLDIKPDKTNRLEMQILNFNYNYELDSIDNRVETLVSLLGKWELFNNDAEKISHSLNDYLERDI